MSTLENLERFAGEADVSNALEEAPAIAEAQAIASLGEPSRIGNGRPSITRTGTGDGGGGADAGAARNIGAIFSSFWAGIDSQVLNKRMITALKTLL
jgi:hypothetical protein